jgi:hypothetical protein
MAENCRVSKRERARAAAHGVRSDQDILDVTVVEPIGGVTDEWELSTVIRAQAGGLNPPLHYKLAAQGCTVPSVDRQGNDYEVVAVVGGDRA